jgi:hypothetical protein
MLSRQDLLWAQAVTVSRQALSQRFLGETESAAYGPPGPGDA